MKVTVVGFGAMRQHLPGGGQRTEVEVRAGSSVADLVDVLGAPRSLVFAVLVDGAQTNLGAELEAGAEVTLMPPFAGG